MPTAVGVFERLLLRLVGAAKAGRSTAPVLDLHGYGVQDALALTERFLRDAVENGVTEVRIVYGKGRHSPGGRGVLREVIPRWLDGEGRRWVASASPEPDAFGEDAAMRVILVTQDVV